MRVTVFAALTCLIFAMGACDLFSEGEPVVPKQGIIGVWQSDQDPNILMTYKTDGKGSYGKRDSGEEMEFKYKFIDDDTVKATFPNGESLEFDVRTTTLYLWMTGRSGHIIFIEITNRF